MPQTHVLRGSNKRPLGPKPASEDEEKARECLVPGISQRKQLFTTKLISQLSKHQPNRTKINVKQREIADAIDPDYNPLVIKTLLRSMNLHIHTRAVNDIKTSVSAIKRNRVAGEGTSPHRRKRRRSAENTPYVSQGKGSCERSGLSHARNTRQSATEG